MKLRIVSLACLAAFALSAGPTPAQDQAAQFINRLRAPKPASSDASASNQSPSALQRKRTGVAPDATETCSYTFTSGSGATYMNYCVSVNGTLENFESPSGVEMLNPQGLDAYEGYGVCDASEGGVEYWDYNYADSGNWLAPVTLTENATEVKIERRTSDAKWLLTQTISKVSGASPAAKIVMELKNTSGGDRVAYLMRFAEFVPDQAGSTLNYNENYDASTDSAWGYIPEDSGYSSPSGPYGLRLQNVGKPAPASTVIEYYGYDYSSPFGPDPCQPLEFDTQGNKPTEGMIVNNEGSGTIFYALSLNNNQTATVTLSYFGF
jgi:hypothetical protein